MKLKRYYIVIYLLTIATIALAQEQQKVFLDSNYNKVRKQSKASFYEIREGQGTRNSFIGKNSLYTLEGKLIHYEFLFKGTRNGTYASIDPESGDKTIGNYKKGKRADTWYKTDDEGNFIGSFEYSEDDRLINEVDLDDDTFYTHTDLPAEYDGGNAAWKLYLRNSIRYPVRIGIAGFQGKIVVKFLIDREGNIIDDYTEDCPHPALLENIKDVFYNSKQWRPAIKDGKAVNSIFVFRSNYNLIGFKK